MVVAETVAAAADAVEQSSSSVLRGPAGGDDRRAGAGRRRPAGARAAATTGTERRVVQAGHGRRRPPTVRRSWTNVAHEVDVGLGRRRRRHRRQRIWSRGAPSTTRCSTATRWSRTTPSRRTPERRYAWSAAAQHPYMVRDDLARIFALPLARVRVEVPYLGGGYGTKSYTKVEPLAAVGVLGDRPAGQAALDVEEAIYTTRVDSARRSRSRTGFDADGGSSWPGSSTWSWTPGRTPTTARWSWPRR